MGNMWLGLMHMVYSAVEFLFGLFPLVDVSINAQIITFLQPFRDIVAPLNWIFPVTEFFTVIALMVTIEGLVALVKITLWIVSTLTLGKVQRM